MKTLNWQIDSSHPLGKILRNVREIPAETVNAGSQRLCVQHNYPIAPKKKQDQTDPAS